MLVKRVLSLSVCLAISSVAVAQEAATETAAAPEAAASSATTLSYLCSDQNIFGDSEVLWDGFLTGMRSSYTVQDGFVDPIGNPIYFESPFIESNLDLIYIWHDFPTNSQLGGGEVSVVAAQIRLALTDRLAFIATKSGYSFIDTGITPEDEGWNDFAVGLKYAFWIDEPNDFVATTGIRWEWHHGDRGILMGGDSGSNELSPFISFAKGWDRWNLLGNVTYRAPMDRNDGNHILSWDLHCDYEIAPETLPGLYPALEVHGLHYLSNGDQLPLDVGGLDYSNIGSDNVAGTFVAWGDLGFRWELTPNVSLGAAYGFPITDPGDDIFNQRVTVRLTLSF